MLNNLSSTKRFFLLLKLASKLLVVIKILDSQ